jgi:hypothetical protein
MRKASFLVLALLAALVFTNTAFADQLTFTLGLGNAGGLAPTNSAANGGYGTITLTLLDSTHIGFDVQGFNGVPTGSPNLTDYQISDFGFNTASGFVGSISCIGVSANWTSNCNASGNLDGMGSYAFIVAGPNGSNAPGDHLQFTVTVAGGTFTTVANLVGSTSGGNCPNCAFAAEVFPFQDGQALGTTGFAGAEPTPTSTVPEPGSLALLGSGLMGMGGIVRRRFIKRSNARV